MSGKTHEQVFQEAVPRLFGFLVSEFGFSLIQRTDKIFEAQSQFASLNMYVHRREVVVEFRPLTDADKRLPESLKLLRGAGAPDVAVIVHCLDRQAKPEFRRDIRPDEVEEELEKYVELLRKYCTPFLKGDFSEWPKVEACLEDRDRRLRSWLESGDRSSLSD